jgi:hypothetical protein
MTHGNDDGSDRLGTVQALLRTAANLLDEVITPPETLRGRWERVFDRMPAEDRATIVAVLEREVAARCIERDGGRDGLTGFTLVRANPKARLYLRAFGPPVSYDTRDEVMRATLRAARMMRAVPAELQLDWAEATLDAFRQLEPAEREALARHNRDMLALLERTAAAPKKAS